MNRPLFISYLVGKNTEYSYLVIDSETKEEIFKIGNFREMNGNIVYFDGDNYLICNVLFGRCHMYYGNLTREIHKSVKLIDNANDGPYFEIGNIDTRIFPNRMIFKKSVVQEGIIHNIYVFRDIKRDGNNILISDIDEEVSKGANPSLILEEKIKQGLISFDRNLVLLRNGYISIGRFQEIYDLNNSYLCTLLIKTHGTSILNVPESHPVFIRFQEKVHLHVKDFIQSRSLCNIVAGYV